MSTFYEGFCTIQIVNELQLLPGVHYSINLTFMGVQSKIKGFLSKRCQFQIVIRVCFITLLLLYITLESQLLDQSQNVVC